MNKGWIAVLSFSAGAAAGYALTKKALMEHYEQLVQEEIDSIKEHFRQRNKMESDEKNAEASEKPTEEERKGYVHYAKSLGYTREEEPEPVMTPHVISPDEFGELPEYDKVSLTYYSDKVLTDENMKPMSTDNIERTVGSESLKHFGEYEDDSVFVRNDLLKVDYEILLDENRYSDLLTNNPY